MHKAPWIRDPGTDQVREAGGMDDLQTDVMRFMAILAFCLVAIFALVQSIPVRPEPPVPQKEVRRQPLTPTPSVEPEKPPARRVSTPTTGPRPAAPPRAAPAPRPAERTFTLRFASDAALHQLVRTGRVQLYALDDEKVWRLSPQTDELFFEAATAPDRMHVMSEGTVPASLVLALSRAGAVSDHLTWGVTLPGSTTDAITRHLRSPAGGTLVILANGDVRREDPDPLSTGGKP